VDFKDIDTTENPVVNGLLAQVIPAVLDWVEPW
jgi:hypothetical protein